MLQDLAKALHLSPAQFFTLWAIVMLVAAVGVGFVLNRVFHYWARKFQNTWGEVVFSLLQPLPIPLLLLAALYTSLELLVLPRAYERLGSKLIFVLVVLVIFYFPAKVVILFLKRLASGEPGLERVTEPASLVVRALFALLAIIIVLDNLGISLTAVWTTLGVGSVAVALALQDTLGNFFAGLYLLADRPVNLGDYIKLDSGQEGFVVRVGWRSTALRMTSNNFVIVPNSTLAKAVITNYSLPEPRMSYGLLVRVSYGTDPARVENILLEVAREAAREGLEGLVAFPKPSLRLIPGFGESSLDFSLNVHVRQFTDQFLVQSELRKRVLKRFAEEGIEMPFPVRTIVPDKSLLPLLAGTAKAPRPPDS